VESIILNIASAEYLSLVNHGTYLTLATPANSFATVEVVAYSLGRYDLSAHTEFEIFNGRLVWHAGIESMAKFNVTLGVTKIAYED
jgi:hypothetical protein